MRTTTAEASDSRSGRGRTSSIGDRMVRTIAVGTCVVLVGALAACRPGDGAATSPRVDLSPPGRNRTAGDGSPQTFTDAILAGGRVIAVGEDESNNVDRPLMAWSEDKGATWHRGAVAVDRGAAMTSWESASSVAAGDGMLVAVGDGADGPVVWSSTDGRSWQRHAGSRAFGADDHVAGVAEVGGRWVAVGTHQDANGDATRLVAWSSDDAGSWQRHDHAELGDHVAVTDVVAASGAVVVSGEVELAGDGRGALWRIAVDGSSVRRVQSLSKHDVGSRSSITSLNATGGRLWATVQMGHPTQPVWSGAVMSSDLDGDSWSQPRLVTGLSTGSDETATAVALVGRSWVVAGKTFSDDRDVVVSVGRTPATARRELFEDGATDGVQDVARVLDVGGEALLVGSTAESGTLEPAVWRGTPTRLRKVMLPSELTGGQPSSAGTALTAVGTTVLAVGSSGGVAATWSAGERRHWLSLFLGQRDAGRSEEVLLDADSDGHGTVMAVGWRRRGTGGEAFAWRRGPDAIWAPVEATAFRTDENRFAFRRAQSVVYGHGRWVAVGYSWDGDGHYDAFGWRSDDGERWAPAVGEGASSASKVRPRGQSLRAKAGDSAWMSAVTSTDDGFAAAGKAGDAPAVWISEDGRRWGARIDLPSPPGISDCSPEAIAAHGRTLVVAGGCSPTTSPTLSHWVVWRSTDGGRAWTLASRRAAATGASAGGDRVGALLATHEGGFVALGSVGRDMSADGVIWTSRDGGTWRRWTKGDQAGEGMQTFVDGVIQDDGSLVALLRDLRQEGGGDRVVDLGSPPR